MGYGDQQEATPPPAAATEPPRDAEAGGGSKGAGPKGAEGELEAMMAMEARQFPPWAWALLVAMTADLFFSSRISARADGGTPRGLDRIGG